MVQGVQIQDGHIIDVNPATGEVIDRVKVSTQEEIDSTVAAAVAAQPAWAATPLKKRIALLKGSVKLLAPQAEELARLVTQEMGKIIKEARAEVQGATNKDALLELVEEANAPVRQSSAVIVREPHGVVAVIAPWNFPMDEILLLALPALAAGNAVVIKPSEVTPLCGERVVRALQQGLNEYPGLVGLLQAISHALCASVVSAPIAATMHP